MVADLLLEQLGGTKRPDVGVEASLEARDRIGRRDVVHLQRRRAERQAGIRGPVGQLEAGVQGNPRHAGRRRHVSPTPVVGHRHLCLDPDLKRLEETADRAHIGRAVDPLIRREVLEIRQCPIAGVRPYPGGRVVEWDQDLAAHETCSDSGVPQHRDQECREIVVVATHGCQRLVGPLLEPVVELVAEHVAYELVDSNGVTIQLRDFRLDPGTEDDLGRVFGEKTVR